MCLRATLGRARTSRLTAATSGNRRRRCQIARSRATPILFARQTNNLPGMPASSLRCPPYDSVRRRETRAIRIGFARSKSQWQPKNKSRPIASTLKSLQAQSRPTETAGYRAALHEEQNCKEEHQNNAYAAPPRCWHGVRTARVRDIQDFSAKKVAPRQTGEQR